MPDVTLHLKAQITSRECAVCGTRLDRSDRDHWWLRNTWTSAVQDYYEGGGMWPTDWLKPCGVLPADYALGAAIEAVASLKAPNGQAQRQEAQRADCPLERDVGRLEPEREDWAHLKRYGYAPGQYMNKCHNCEHVVDGLDKRAFTCLPCQQCGAMTADEALSRCMGARAEGGCHGNDLWPD